MNRVRLTGVGFLIRGNDEILVDLAGKTGVTVEADEDLVWVRLEKAAAFGPGKTRLVRVARRNVEDL